MMPNSDALWRLYIANSDATELRATVSWSETEVVLFDRHATDVHGNPVRYTFRGVAADAIREQIVDHMYTTHSLGIDPGLDIYLTNHESGKHAG